ncbi:uncharacterized protein JN550_009020 [Neoarthrinium moseri]|uniref:uncharacterized protein n=1 Tax=Neoarthrinium moseri TaxID=1658444 RepID=UPI001FDE0507|nr:uncharacterized protein JN550_009020 [Neoarthrinium moseri]KAI1864463.1 hypothetical protein JN550_009020 [Neoarthrinium moseri]
MDLVYGNYGFATAKVIDVAWDTLIAQAGRVFHGYIFYRHVAKKVLICYMEYSTVTYEDYISVLFSQSWPGTLKFFFGTLFCRYRIRAWFLLIGLTYMLLYTFLFSTIWSAASGYISPAERAYQMPDGTFLPLATPHLALCWKIDSARLGLAPGHVELGPDFSTLQPWLFKSSAKGSWSELELFQKYNSEVPQPKPNSAKREEPLYPYKPGKPTLSADDDRFAFRGWYRSIWDNIGPAAMGLDYPASLMSKEIFSYAFTRRMLQVVFNSTGVNTTGSNTVINLPEADTTAAVDLIDTRFYTKYLSVDVGREDELPEVLEFLDFKHVDFATNSEEETQHMKLFNTWPMLAYLKPYILNDSMSGPGIVPYNSTLSFNGTEHALDAPFLDIGFGCSHPYNYFTALGNCVCYNGEPLTIDWYQDSNMACLDSPRYVWGFSSFIVFIGLLCELIWIIFAICIRGYCQWWSVLMKYPRVKRAGVVWNVLELAEALNRDLEVDRASLREDILRKSLKTRDSIGYEADVDAFGRLKDLHIVSRKPSTGILSKRKDKENIMESCYEVQ